MAIETSSTIEITNDFSVIRKRKQVGHAVSLTDWNWLRKLVKSINDIPWYFSSAAGVFGGGFLACWIQITVEKNSSVAVNPVYYVALFACLVVALICIGVDLLIRFHYCGTTKHEVLAYMQHIEEGSVTIEGEALVEDGNQSVADKTQSDNKSIFASTAN
jgi:hypothetical protein